MPEFLDFLHHKYAYVAIGEFQPGRFAEAQRLYEKAVSTYKEGFIAVFSRMRGNRILERLTVQDSNTPHSCDYRYKGAYLLQKPNSDEGIAIIIWENIEDMEANQNEAYRKFLEEMGPLFVKPPVTDFYEVCSEIGGFESNQ